MTKSSIARGFWYWEERRVVFAIDLSSWGLAVRFGEFWRIQVLCFILECNG